MARLNDATATVLFTAKPTGEYTARDGSRAKLTATEQRENAVYYRGVMDAFEEVLGDYLGGVP